MPPSSADLEAPRAPWWRRGSGTLPAAGCLRSTIRPARAPRPRALRWARALYLLGAVGLGAPRGASGEPVPGVPSEAVVQLSAEKCETCFTIDQYMVKGLKYVYVLFYRMGSVGDLNLDMNGKFVQTAKEWLHSRVAFAKIDIDRDRRMAESMHGEGSQISAPSTVMFRDGKPLLVERGDWERLKDEHHANPEGHKWLLTKYLGDDTEGTNLHYALPLKNGKSLKKALKKSKFTLVGFFEAAKGDAWEAFHEFARNASDSDGVAAADGIRRVKAAALKLGFGSAVGKVDFTSKGVTAPAVALYRRKSRRPSKIFALGGERARMLSSLVEWAADELSQAILTDPPAQEETADAPVDKEL